MKRCLFALLLCCIPYFLAPQKAIALRALTLDESLAQGASSSLLEIDIPRGHSVTVNFGTAGYAVHAVWLDNPARIGVATDVPLCTSDSRSRDCGGASLLRFNQLSQPIGFDSNQSRSFGNQSVVTVITSNRSSERIAFQFVASLTATNSGSYSMISIVPDGQGALNNETLQSRYFADTITAGIAEANRQGIVDASNSEWGNVNNFITLLTTGTYSVEEAIVQSGVSRRLVNELATLGGQ